MQRRACHLNTLDDSSLVRPKPSTTYSHSRHCTPQSRQTRSYSRSVSAQSQSHQSTISKGVSLDTKKMNKTIDPVTNTRVYRSLQILKESRGNQRMDRIRAKCLKSLEEKTKDNKLELAECLLNLHDLFRKINEQIVQSLLLLGKQVKYYRGEIITADGTGLPSRSRQDLGFLLYGKLELFNDEQFYSRQMRNCGTLFEERFVRRGEKYRYMGRVMEESVVLWVSQESYYLIRKECFVNMDLKYMFHELENHLKFSLIHKKLIKVE